jgi:nucleoid-associated protein YgaU
MSTPQKSKGLFDAALNLVSNRDEKAAIEALQKHVAEIEQQLATAEANVFNQSQKASAAERRSQELQTSLSKSMSDLQSAKTTISDLEQKLSAAQTKIMGFEAMQAQTLMQQSAASAERAAILATHTIAADESLSHLALKYYGHASEPYWRLIYNANKGVIGDNPNRVRVGLTLNIPVLPPEMKK